MTRTLKVADLGDNRKRIAFIVTVFAFGLLLVLLVPLLFRWFGAGTRGTCSSTFAASEGTWRFSQNGRIRQSFLVDLERDGDSWRLTTPRVHAYSAWFARLSNPILDISQADSTVDSNAQVSASLNVTELWNTSNTFWLTATVSNDGVVTVACN